VKVTEDHHTALSSMCTSVPSSARMTIMALS